MKVSAGPVADQCRELGLKVGDTIVGKETYGKSWDETSLTLLWIGTTECMFSVRSRNSDRRKWSSPVEDACWKLEYRDWEKIGAQS